MEPLSNIYAWDVKVVPHLQCIIYLPLQDIWNRLLVSNFLNTLPLSSTKLLDTMMVISALL